MTAETDYLRAEITRCRHSIKYYEGHPLAPQADSQMAEAFVELRYLSRMLYMLENDLKISDMNDPVTLTLMVLTYPDSR